MIKRINKKIIDLVTDEKISAICPDEDSMEKIIDSIASQLEVNELPFDMEWTEVGNVILFKFVKK